MQFDKLYLTHRMIWLRQTGELPEFIDHLNHIRNDNSWINLRDASRQENAVNKNINKNNVSGYTGVSWMKDRQKFRATITVNKKSIHLGLFSTAEDAYVARQAAEVTYNFHPNHGSNYALS